MRKKHSRRDPTPIRAGSDHPWLIFVGAAVAAVAFWTYQQRQIEAPLRTERSAPSPAPGSADPAGREEPTRTPAKANLVRYFSADDYPVSAIRREESGTVKFSLEIDRQGRVTRCDITDSSGSAALDQATCSILRRRARYEPARDANGATVPDKDTGRIRWELPPE